jgi:hypothetical protein
MPAALSPMPSASSPLFLEGNLVARRGKKKLITIKIRKRLLQKNGDAVKNNYQTFTNGKDSFAYSFELSQFNRAERENCEGD